MGIPWSIPRASPWASRGHHMGIPWASHSYGILGDPMGIPRRIPRASRGHHIGIPPAHTGRPVRISSDPVDITWDIPWAAVCHPVGIPWACHKGYTVESRGHPVGNRGHPAGIVGASRGHPVGSSQEHLLGIPWASNWHLMDIPHASHVHRTSIQSSSHGHPIVIPWAIACDTANISWAIVGTPWGWRAHPMGILPQSREGIPCAYRWHPRVSGGHPTDTPRASHAHHMGIQRGMSWTPHGHAVSIPWPSRGLSSASRGHLV